MSTRHLRPHYLRLVIVAACVGALTVQANTYGTVYHRHWLVNPPPTPCAHGSHTDLDPKSPTYGMPDVCDK